MKLARIAIFLTGVLGIVTGGLITISALKSNQEQDLLRVHQNLKSQASLIVDQFFTVLESAKKLNPKSSNELLPYVAHYGTVKLRAGTPEEFESFSINDLALQERVLISLRSQLSTSELQLVKLGLGTYEMGEAGGKVGIFVAQPVFKPVVSGAIDPEAIDKLNLILIDPSRAFPGFEKLAMGNQNAFIIHKDGKVLAHTRSAFVGADLKRLNDLKDSISNLFLGAQTGFVQRYSQSDGTRQVLAMVRAGVFPFAVGIEQKAAPQVLSTEWVLGQMDSGSVRRGAGVAFVLISISLVLFALLSAWASRGLRLELENGARPRNEGESVFSGNRIEDPSSGLGSAAEQFVESVQEKGVIEEGLRSHSHSLAQSSRPDSSQVSEMLSRIEASLTLESVEKELVQSASEITQGSAIYFRYQRRMQNLSLQICSDGVELDQYHSIQAYVRKDIELQVEQLSDSGKVASLTHYGPIKKIMQTRFRGKTYEAWAVTSSPEVSLQSKLVGVLILLEPDQIRSGFRSVLAQLLKEAGNYLYAHGNKLRSRNQDPVNHSLASPGTDTEA